MRSQHEPDPGTSGREDKPGQPQPQERSGRRTPDRRRRAEGALRHLPRQARWKRIRRGRYHPHTGSSTPRRMSACFPAPLRKAPWLPLRTCRWPATRWLAPSACLAWGKFPRSCPPIPDLPPNSAAVPLLPALSCASPRTPWRDGDVSSDRPHSQTPGRAPACRLCHRSSPNAVDPGRGGDAGKGRVVAGRLRGPRRVLRPHVTVGAATPFLALPAADAEVTLKGLRRPPHSLRAPPAAPRPAAATLPCCLAFKRGCGTSAFALQARALRQAIVGPRAVLRMGACKSPGGGARKPGADAASKLASRRPRNSAREGSARMLWGGGRAHSSRLGPRSTLAECMPAATPSELSAAGDRFPGRRCGLSAGEGQVLRASGAAVLRSRG